jgi:hypothetical protein
MYHEVDRLKYPWRGLGGTDRPQKFFKIFGQLENNGTKGGWHRWFKRLFRMIKEVVIGKKKQIGIQIWIRPLTRTKNVMRHKI